MGSFSHYRIQTDQQKFHYYVVGKFFCAFMPNRIVICYCINHKVTISTLPQAVRGTVTLPHGAPKVTYEC